MASVLERALESGLRIRPGEHRRTAIMAAYAANAIGAVVVGRSIRDALYLAHRPARGLAGMYVVSSFAIVIVSWLYARVADRVPRGKLNAASALCCAFLCAIAFLFLSGTPGTWVYPALYIFVEVMGSLIVIQFWTLANDVFHAREAKRLFGIIGGGGTLANVVFGLLVGHYAKRIGAVNLLWLMVAQLSLCAALAQSAARLASAAPIPMARRTPPRKQRTFLSRAGALSVFANRHLTLVAAIGCVSAAAVTIVDFQFKTAAAAVLQQNELAGYFGRFYGICGGIALAIQIWVTGRVLERYGLLASLLPLPLGLAAGSGFSAAIPNPGLFTQSLAKGSDTVFRYTINDASMQLLYVPVPHHIRGRAKAFIDGILKPVAIAATGAALYFYKRQGGGGRPLTIAVLVCVAVWVLLLFRARGEYVRSLVESLERRHLDLGATPRAGDTEAITRVLRAALHADAATTLHALSLLDQAGQSDFLPELRALLRHEDARIRAAAVERLGELRARDLLPQMRALLDDSSPEVRAAALGAVCAIEQEESVPTVLPFLDAKKSPEAIVRAAAAVALIRHAGLDGVLAAAEPLKALLAAEDPRDRAAAADALGNIGVRGFYRPLLSFLDDPDAGVRRRAIAAAGKLRTPELVPQLLHAFRARETALEAASALTAFGPGIEPQLQATLCDEDQPLECRRGSALVLGRLSTRAAAEALILALQSPRPEVRRGAARALNRISRRERELRFDTSQVDAAVHAELQGARLALAALKRLELPLPLANVAPQTPGELLAVSLIEERDARVLQALALLEVLLPAVHLDVIAESLRSGQAAARGNAIEVLDNALPERWKHLVLATLDEMKRRSDTVLADPRPKTQLCAALILGESGSWVAACAARFALDCSPVAPLGELRPAMEAALSSPEAALREAAAVFLHQRLAQDAAPLLLALANDPAKSVRRTAGLLLSVEAAKPRVSA